MSDASAIATTVDVGGGCSDDLTQLPKLNEPYSSPECYFFFSTIITIISAIMFLATGLVIQLFVAVSVH